MSLIIIILLFLLFPSCSPEKNAVTADSGAQPAYVLMEKILADQPGRPRTTMKIVIPNAAGRQAVSVTMSKALDDAKKQDPSLKAVIIWAYRSRGELNGPSFTLGKLEWSADGNDFAGRNPLSPNPKIEAIAP